MIKTDMRKTLFKKFIFKKHEHRIQISYILRLTSHKISYVNSSKLSSHN
jgi:hypothetical protein